MPALTVRNAEIKTATVEIKTLTVSGKQVTLAVFRQLRNEDLIAEDGTLNGVPWGTVNYHPDKCADTDAHLHVVWQRGADLLRSTVTCTPFYGRRFYSDAGDKFLAAHVRDVALGRARFFAGKMPELGRDLELVFWPGTEAPFAVGMVGSDPVRDLLVACQGHQETISNSERYSTDRTWRMPGSNGRYVKATAAEAVDAWAQAVGTAVAAVDEYLGAPTDTAELHAQYRAAIAAEVERRDRHAAFRRTLADLPQLFIAV